MAKVKAWFAREKYHIVFSVDFERAKGDVENNTTESTNAVEPQFKYAHAFGVNQVRTFIERYLNRDAVVMHPLKMGSYIDKEIFKENVIIVGWRHGISGFDNFLSRLKTPHYYDEHGQLMNRGGPIEVRRPKIGEDGIIESDFGLIRIIHPKTGKLIILFDAHYGLGILGLTKLMTTLVKRPKPNNEVLKIIVDKVNSSQQGCHLLISVKNPENKDILDSDDIYCKMSGFEHFDVNTDMLLEAIKDATHYQIEIASSLEADFMSD